GTAITIRVRNSVNVAGKRREASLIRMSLAGQRKRHHGAAMKSIFKGNNPGSSSVSARYLYRVFNRLGPAVYKQSLLWIFAGSDLIHPLGKMYIIFVWRDLHTRVKKFIQLITNGSENRLLPMPNV